MTPDARLFRNTMGLFATGVAVIAVNEGEQVHAMTANAVSALSLEPMLVLFCPSKKARLSTLLPAVDQFSINFLRADQGAISTYFAGGWKTPTPPAFHFIHTAAGLPRLEGSLATIGCRIQQLIDGGDHWLVIGAVQALEVGIEPHRPLLFFKGLYQQLDMQTSAPAPSLTEVSDEPAAVYYD